MIFLFLFFQLASFDLFTVHLLHIRRRCFTIIGLYFCERIHTHRVFRYAPRAT